MMTHSEFAHLLKSLSGLSPEQMQRLRRELDSALASAHDSDAGPLLGSMDDHADMMDEIVADTMRKRPPDSESSNQDVQQRLLSAGIVSEIKPPITDMTPYRNRKAVPIQGAPLSETVIRERR